MDTGSIDTIAMMRRVVATADGIVDNVGHDELALQSPCEEWSVRDVLNHITGGSLMFAECVEHGAIPDERLGELMAGDNLGDDPIRAWKAASQKAIAAFDIPGVLDKLVKLPFGEMPAGIALNIAIFDVLTHAADIAIATGQQLPDHELVEIALAVGQQMIGPDLRVPGVFGPEQPAPDGANPQERLLAFAGRKV